MTTWFLTRLTGLTGFFFAVAENAFFPGVTMYFLFDINPFLEQLASPPAYRLALALLHFLWQGFAIALIAAILMRIVGRRSPHRRYAIGLLGLMAMAIAPAVTFFLVTPSAPRPEFVPTAITKSRENNLAALPPGELTVEINRLDDVIARLESQLAHAHTPPEPASTDTVASRTWWEVLRQWQPYLLLAWLLGATMCSLRLAIGAPASWRYRWGKKPLPEAAREALINVAGRLGMKPPRVFVSERVCEALVVGFFRPMILLPAAWIGKIPPDLLEAVLAHEIAHLRRHDLWINLAQRLLETLLFYHPALWWLSRRVRAEREYCCDEIAARTLENRAAYARALEFAAAERLLAGRLATLDAALVANMGGEEMALLNRVRRVLGGEPIPSRNRWRWATGVVLILPACLWGAFLWADGLVWAGVGGDAPVAAKRPEFKAQAAHAEDFATSVVDNATPFLSSSKTSQSEESDDKGTEPQPNVSKESVAQLKEDLKESRTGRQAMRRTIGELTSDLEHVRRQLMILRSNGPAAAKRVKGRASSIEHQLRQLINAELEDQADMTEIDAQVEAIFDKLRRALKKTTPKGEHQPSTDPLTTPKTSKNQFTKAELINRLSPAPHELQINAVRKELEAIKGQRAIVKKNLSRMFKQNIISKAKLKMGLLEYDEKIAKVQAKLAALKQQAPKARAVSQTAVPDDVGNAVPKAAGHSQLREQYEQALRQQLEALKKQRFRMRELTRRGAGGGPASIIAWNQKMVEVLGKLLQLENRNVPRPAKPTNATVPDIAVPAPSSLESILAASRGKNDQKPSRSATATPLDGPIRPTFLEPGEYEIKFNSQDKLATVTFYEPSLNLLIHVKTPLEQLPDLLKRLAKRRGSGQSTKPHDSMPTGPVPHYDYVPAAPPSYSTEPASKRSSENDSFQPPEPDRKFQPVPVF